jgi:UDP-glucose 4-epimerase
MSKKILLTGGAGYIGSHVALAFLERGDRVGIYDNLSTGLRENVHEGSDFFEGDILDSLRLKEVLSMGWDAVVHLAAFKAAGESMVDPSKYAVNNISGTLNLITCCIDAGVRRFVLSSSAAVYGEPEYLPVDEKHPTNPENYYGFTKLDIERNLHWFDRQRGLRFAALRYFNAAGYDPDGRIPGLEQNPANLIPVVMEVASGKREKLLVFGNDYDTIDGTGVRDYIHVSDLADAHVKAFDYIDEGDCSLTVNLGSEQGFSVLQIVESAERISGKKIALEIVPRRAGDPAKLIASSSMAYEKLKWKPRFSDLDSLIQTTWNSYTSES